MLTIDPSHTAEIRPNVIAVTSWPGGYWAVKIRERDADTVAFAVPRRGTSGEPFDIAIAVGSTPLDVVTLRTIAVDWTAQARSISGRADACVYAGDGDATEETPLKAGTWYAQVAPPSDLLDRLLAARAAHELGLYADAADDRRDLESEAQTLNATSCTNTYGDDGDALMCERDASHDGPCAALVLFPAPTPTT